MYDIPFGIKKKGSKSYVIYEQQGQTVHRREKIKRKMCNIPEQQFIHIKRKI